jgi:hypothetical protein
MLALAMKTSDEELARLLADRASDYLDQASAVEAEAPRHVAQQAEQPQPDDLEKKK